MPLHFRALVFVFCLELVAFVVYARLRPKVIPRKEYIGWCTLWLSLTTAAFITSFYWLFIAAAIGIVLLLKPKDSSERVIVYLLILPVLPSLTNPIPFVGGLEYLFALTNPRLLTILLLVPLFLRSMFSPERNKTRPYLSDKCLILYIIIIGVIGFQGKTPTDGIRGITLLLLDIAVPYFVISRYIQTSADLVKAVHALLISAFILAIIAIFESIMNFFLFHTLYTGLGIQQPVFSPYSLTRGGLPRVIGPFEQPIVFSYFLAIGLSALIAVSGHFRTIGKLVIGGAIVVGMFCTLSRGPWIGFFVFLLIYCIAVRKITNLLQFAGVALLGILVLYLVYDPSTPNRTLAFLIELIPFIGGEYDDTVSYRQQLFFASVSVIAENPFFGSNDYVYSPKLEALRQGQGIIDMVNTYLYIALSFGLVTLSVFLFLFIVPTIHAFSFVRRHLKEDVDLHRSGAMLSAMMAATLVVIATVSSIDFISIYTWIIFSLLVAYIRIVRS